MSAAARSHPPECRSRHGRARPQRQELAAPLVEAVGRDLGPPRSGPGHPHASRCLRPARGASERRASSEDAPLVLGGDVGNEAGEHLGDRDDGRLVAPRVDARPRAVADLHAPAGPRPSRTGSGARSRCPRPRARASLGIADVRRCSPPLTSGGCAAAPPQDVRRSPYALDVRRPATDSASRGPAPGGTRKGRRAPSRPAACGQTLPSTFISAPSVVRERVLVSGPVRRYGAGTRLGLGRTGINSRSSTSTSRVDESSGHPATS